MNAMGGMEMGGTSGMSAGAGASTLMAHCGLMIVEGPFLEPLSVDFSSCRGALIRELTRYFISLLVTENPQGRLGAIVNVVLIGLRVVGR